MRAGILLTLRRVTLQEASPERPPTIVPLREMSLDEARQLASWPLQLPADLPPGYRLIAVAAGEIHSFARGPTVLMFYGEGSGVETRWLRVTQLRATRPLDEPVAPGAARRITAGATDALLIDGEWIERDGRREWQRGGLLRLIIEDGDIVVQLEADQRDGWDGARLADVAASLRAE